MNRGSGGFTRIYIPAGESESMGYIRLKFPGTHDGEMDAGPGIRQFSDVKSDLPNNGVQHPSDRRFGGRDRTKTVPRGDRPSKRVY